MQHGERKHLLAVLTGAVLLTLGGTSPAQGKEPAGRDPLPKSVIVQGRDGGAAAELVRGVGGKVTHQLGIIDAVAAELGAFQLQVLKRSPGLVRVYEDRRLATAGQRGKPGSEHPYTHYPTLVGADRLHAEGITGQGVTLAVVDTGYAPLEPLAKNTRRKPRILAHYDAILNFEGDLAALDGHGHGDHVSGISVNSALAEASGKYNGIAPDADLVVVKAFDADGQGRYADVIRGLEWVLVHQSFYGIRVLNLSFSAPPLSYYWDDPLNQAVMRAWQAGIVVVSSAGNLGPAPMTIGVPGNVPYVITVGAMSDNYTPDDGSDDFLASFSATGPTVEAFVKPEVVAPGGHILSLTTVSLGLAEEYSDFLHDSGMYFTMSGTSQAAAMVSGIALLTLQADPSLSPDEVKCRLMASAGAAIDDAGNPAYTPFQQGVGRVNAYDAVYSIATGCANRGLNIHKDVAGEEHYLGPVRVDEAGNYFVEGVGGEWDGVYARGDGTPWVDAAPWTAGILDVGGTPWVDAALDVGGTPWVDAHTWSNALSEVMAINVWVDQE